jgi:hypothetical protein
MNAQPQSLHAEVPFPYKHEIIAALANGATCSKYDRHLLAGRLLGTYQIRLNIAQDPKINDNLPLSANAIARDLTTIVKNLSVDPATEVSVYSIRFADHAVYQLFEYAHDGGYIGCLRSPWESGDPALPIGA